MGHRAASRYWQALGSLCLTLIPAAICSATQWVSSVPKTAEISGYVESPAVLVTLLADTAAQSAQTMPSVLRTLRVSYGSTTVTVPDEILSLAPHPHIQRLGFSYLGCLDFADNAAELTPSPCKSRTHPALMVFLPYGPAYAEDGRSSEFPYLAIEIDEGRVDRITSWRFDGHDWVDVRYDWRDGRAVPSDE